MYPLHQSADLEALIEDIGDRRVVMLGEASHGTHEYYTWRTAISKILIERKGFQFIAVEGDWPDCYRINQYVKGYADSSEDIASVLRTFDRWPTWMWANWEIASLAEWMKNVNKNKPADQKVGFYGLDVYSLWDSMKSMIHHLEKSDPAAAGSVRKAIQCFEPFQEDAQLYAKHTLRDRGCREEVLALLKEIRLRAQFLDGDPEAGLNAEQNAFVAVNAEKYYRSMIGFDNESWNVRDHHMTDTLDRLLRHHGSPEKAIVWEHNTHVGDARATNMANAGMVNIGQLARERYGEDQVYLTGFASSAGTVIAGDEWGAPMEVMIMPPARAGSIEETLHDHIAGQGYFLMNAVSGDKLFNRSVPHRAIGVVYNPDYDRWSNYVPTVLARRYDAFIYLDKTTALHPLHLHPDEHLLPATFPFNL